MDEEREQPLEELANVSGETIVDGAESENGSLNQGALLEDQDNSTVEPCDLGKFKNPQALLDAYNNLQAEFTKKCQKLSQLEKETSTQQQPNKEQLDVCLNQFLSSHAEAGEFADEICQKVANANITPSLQAMEDAWAGIVLKHISSSALNDDKIVDKYVLSCDSVRNLVIQKYLDALKSNSPPFTISSSGQRVADVTIATPSSLGDAKTVVEKMFS